MISPEPVINKFIELGGQAVLCDVDDTLIQSYEEFVVRSRQFKKVVCERSGIPMEVLEPAYEAADKRSFNELKVSPKRWRLLVDILGDELGHREVFDEQLGILLSVYESVPKVIDGVLPVLRTLRKSNLRLGVVTHAEIDWTMRKMDGNGLTSFFELIHVVDVNKFKSKEDWRTAAECMGVDPKNVIVVGDSLRNDIGPACEIGAAGIMPPCKWSVYATGVMPRRAVAINNYGEFFEGMNRVIDIP